MELYETTFDFALMLGMGIGFVCVVTSFFWNDEYRGKALVAFLLNMVLAIIVSLLGPDFFSNFVVMGTFVVVLTLISKIIFR